MNRQSRPSAMDFSPSGPPPEAVETEFEQQVLAVLRREPEVAIPADFAAAVAQRACAQPLPRFAHLPGWGPRLAAASGVLMTAGMFALAPMAAPSWHNGWFDAQLVLLLELSALLLFAQRLLASE